MATLVLTTVGTLVGGPVGGAIGALIGNRIDGALLTPGRRGPRLGDLSVQTSSYGSAIPKLFGRMRVAGTVIWATDLKETRTRGGGGKGQPRTTGYSYAASFAVALSARTVRSIGRIWADGMLLRGAAGDWKTATGFRFHDGREGQAVDPLIAAVEGIANAPAYRGIAYVVFEDLQLADYGNRIPSLRFEVEADAGPVTVGAVAAALSDGVVRDDTQTTLLGYAADGDSVRGAIETLAAAIPLTLIAEERELVLREAAGAAIRFPDKALGAVSGERGGIRHDLARRAAGTVPEAVSLTYYDVARDYQAGLQQARHGGAGRREMALELPAVLSSGDAKTIVERRLDAEWAGRRTAVMRLPWRWMTVMPGQAVILSDAAEAWRVSGVTLDRMVVLVQLVGVAIGAAKVLPIAVPGRVLSQADMPHGATTITLFELPPGIGEAGLSVAAAGTSPAWRQAVLEASVDGGATVTPVGRTAPAAVIGRVAQAIPPGGSAMFDDVTTVEVRLLNDAMMLLGCSDDQMLGGANRALIGGELIQFGRAEQIGVARYRIGRLLRGRHGTEAAIAAHGPGENFILIDPDRFVTMPAAAGGRVTMLATGIGDAVPVAAIHDVRGLAMRPLAPVHLFAAREGDGGIGIAWIRRSRAGWDWVDGVDVPLVEEREWYRLSIRNRHGGVRDVETTAANWLYPAAMQAEDGFRTGDRLMFSVVQVGTVATSVPADAVVWM